MAPIRPRREKFEMNCRCATSQRVVGVKSIDRRHIFEASSKNNNRVGNEDVIASEKLQRFVHGQVFVSVCKNDADY